MSSVCRISKMSHNNHLPNEIQVHRLNLEPELPRERSHSASDFDELSMDSNNGATLQKPVAVEQVKDKRSLSLTPQPIRRLSYQKPLSRQRIKRGQTIDTPSITKVEHEEYSLLNQYKVSDIIGHGAFGIVHKAVSSEDTETYALKIVPKRRLIKKGFIARRPKGPNIDPLSDIRKEIAILKKLNHPNVVKLVEVLDDPNEDDMVLVFEFISNGRVMPEITPENRLPEERARKYFIELILGLEYLHSQKIIHRDIKPENLLLDELDTLKIADFGVSEELTSTQLKRSAGTRAFAAPETVTDTPSGFSGKPLDIWAAGVTLYCFVFGNVPFSASGVVELYQKIETQPVSFPEDVPVSEDLKHLISQLLDKDPGKRITMEEIRCHPWITSFNGHIPTKVQNCSNFIDVNETEIMGALQHHRTPIHILVMIKQMAKQKSLKNPYSFESPNASPTGSPVTSPKKNSLDRRINFATSKTIPAISISEDNS